MKDVNRKIETDTPYIFNDALPVWIVTISGWGSESIEDAFKRMELYKSVAEKMQINIEFSSRLGTFQSYKRAPVVAEQIETHNTHTFAVYEKTFGEDWRIKFIHEVKKNLPE